MPKSFISISQNEKSLDITFKEHEHKKAIYAIIYDVINNYTYLLTDIKTSNNASYSCCTY